MDFLHNSFGISPTVTLKFEDEEDIMNISEILTPRAKFIPPPPPLQDEDSGLGMEFDSIAEADEGYTTKLSETPILKQTFSIRRGLFEKSKRLFDGDDDGSITKKPRYSVGSNTGSKRKRTMTKSLSFGDQPVCRKSLECDVISAVERLVEEKDLIGNGVQTFCLPTISGRHSDLKSITPETMADVLAGKYDDVISSYQIIDCRYPYEYDGGHIKGAENLYRREQIMELAENAPSSGEGRHILIFHCEFSSERGPKMSRFLRNKDREINKDRYPFLNFPEVYLLHNGYKAFYESHEKLCEPMNYKPMLHENHTEDLRHFRSKSKSWNGGSKKRVTCRRRF